MDKYLNQWINEEYLKPEKIKQIQRTFKKTKPFEYMSLDNFLIDEKANKLYLALKKEDYYLENHDLYQFLRTVDFKYIKNKMLNQFYEFIKSEKTINFFEQLTGSKINKKIVDLHSLKLLNTHYLLCHDDLVLSRKFAFIFNLSQDWKKKDGGQLEIFDSDKKGNVLPVIRKSIIPKFNRFNLFKVQKISYHQINEVESEKERITIGGWYHE